MAINLFVRHPTKSLAPSAAWPTGEPKDIVTAGDNTGTPWEVAVTKDIMGFQQALLLQAGISPTDIPETAIASQYLDAMSSIFSRQATATTAILTSDLTGVPGLRTLGYASPTDNGGALWVATGVTTPGKAGTTEFSLGFIYDVAGIQFAIGPGVINPRQYGAVGDGVTNDAAAIQAAIDTQNGRNGGEVHLDPGTYFSNSQITLKDLVSFTGDGNGTTLTFAAAAGSFPNAACLWAAGSNRLITALSTDVAPGDQDMTFGAAHLLENDDLIYIIDPRSNSYNEGSTNYRAGEFFVVDQVTSSTVVTLTTPAIATTNPNVNTTVTTYDAAQSSVRDVSPVRCSIRDIKIIGVSDASANNVLAIDQGRQCTVERVWLGGSVEALMLVSHSYDTKIDDVSLHQLATGATGDDGVLVTYCQLVDVGRIRSHAPLTLVHVGVDSATDSFTSRYIDIHDCVSTDQGTEAGSVVVAGHAEYVTVRDSILTGLTLGGDHINVHDCEIFGHITSTGSFGNGFAVVLAELIGLDVRITDCKLKALGNVGQALIQWNPTSETTWHIATLFLTDLVIDLNGFNGKPAELQTNETTDHPSVRVQGLRVFGSNNSGDEFGIGIQSTAGWSRADVVDCISTDQRWTFKGIERTTIKGCDFRNSPNHGILIAGSTTTPFAAKFLTITGCTVRKSQQGGVLIQDADMTVFAANNIMMNCNQSGSFSVNATSFVFLPGAGTSALTLQSNIFGDDQAVLTQANSYTITNVDTVFDSNTVTIGALSPSITGGTVTTSNQFDSDEDHSAYTGSMSLTGADAPTSPAGVRDLALGNSSGDHGIHMLAGTSDENAIVMGDTSDPDRNKIQAQNSASSRRMIFTVDGTPMTAFESNGINPWTSTTDTLGTSIKRWGDIYGGPVHANRLFLDNGSFIIAGTDLSHTGWGGGAAFTGVTTGRDPLLQIEIASGTGPSPSANPTITYTYSDGASSSQVPLCFLTNRKTPLSTWSVSAISSTAVTIMFHGTPVDSTNYGVMVLLVWLDD
jgi:hypothetical protein